MARYVGIQYSANAHRAVGALEASSSLIGYDIAELVPPEGLTAEQDEHLAAISAMAEAVYMSLLAVRSDLRRQKNPVGIIWNDEWPRQVRRFGKRV